MQPDTQTFARRIDALLKRWTDLAIEEGLEPDKVRSVERRLRVEAGGEFVGDVASGDGGRTSAATGEGRFGFLLMLALAFGAALAVKVPQLLGYGSPSADPDGVYLVNLGFFVFPFVAAYFLVKHRRDLRLVALIAAAFVLLWAAANLYPFTPGGHTQILSAIHTPLALWLVTGVAYMGAQWRSPERRMDYIRYSGETFVNWVLLCLGGAVLTVLTLGVFLALGIQLETFVTEWMVPCGMAAAVVVAAWLADTRSGVVAGMAPMLARVFTPLFAALLVALLIAVAQSRGVMAIDRESLIILDLLLVVVLALTLYSMASRRSGEAGWFDRLQLVLVGSTLIVDVIALANILGRVVEFGSSPNRLAALGMNVLVLVALAGSLVWQATFVAGKGDAERIEWWHMRYLPVYLVWVVIVAVGFPVAFGWV